jgi:hypothetical protein
LVLPATLATADDDRRAIEAIVGYRAFVLDLAKSPGTQLRALFF